ncbi:MAG: hypothetical protein IJ174_01750, partial [Clostridia bacterium]|nr:hypothetical protein [Clostridia bacterium]
MSEGTRHRLKNSVNWKLMAIDGLFYVFTCAVLLLLYPYSIDRLKLTDSLLNAVVGFVCVFGARFGMRIYRQIWRYASTKEYLLLVLADLVACMVFIMAIRFLPKHKQAMRAIALIMANLLGAINMRFVYQFIYQHRNSRSRGARFGLAFLRCLTGTDFKPASIEHEDQRIRVAIVGAGSVGAMLAQELLSNPAATYVPVCFVDTSEQKIGRDVHGIEVLAANANLRDKRVQEVIFALPDVSLERKKELYDIYKNLGYKVKIYDYPTMRNEEAGQRELRDVAIEDLLYRKTVSMINEET